MPNKMKKSLLNVNLMDKQIQAKSEEINRLYDLITKITPTLKSDVVSSVSDDKFGETVAKIVDLQNELINETRNLIDEKAKILGYMDRLTNADEYSVLYGYYFAGKTFEQISEELHRSLRNTYFVHTRALENIDKLILNDIVDNLRKEEQK